MMRCDVDEQAWRQGHRLGNACAVVVVVVVESQDCMVNIE
jgi:hypothetical protein